MTQGYPRFHLADELAAVATNPVDAEQVPASHFGPMRVWWQSKAALQKDIG